VLVEREIRVHLANKGLADMMVSMVKTVFPDPSVLQDDKDVMVSKVKLVSQGHKDH